MDGLHVYLLGRFQVQYGEQVLSGFHLQKVQELFAYLLLNRPRSTSRESLAGLLWEGRGALQSKKSLRQTLWQLQSALSAAGEPGGAPLLLAEGDTLRINPEVELWLDATTFEQAASQVQGVPTQELDAGRIQQLRAAADLYQGDLLDRCYEEWCLCERERLQNIYFLLLDKLMSYCEAHREVEAGLEYGARILRYDRASERTYRRLMRLHYQAGSRTDALRQYERCVAALAETLDAKPGRRTVALYEQIRGDETSPTPLTPLATAAVIETTPPPPPTVVGDLEQLRTTLAHLQRQVQQTLHAIELALSGRR